MAKEYRAVSHIRVGRAPDEDVEFSAGDLVTGLTKDQMVELWNANVLTEHDPEERKPDERDEMIASLQQQLAELQAEKAAAAVPSGESPETETPTPETPETPETPPAE